MVISFDDVCELVIDCMRVRHKLSNDDANRYGSIPRICDSCQIR